MAHPQLQAVRERYSYCCGYCGVSETKALKERLARRDLYITYLEERLESSSIRKETTE